MGLFDDILIVEYHKDTQSPQIAWRFLTDPKCAHGNNNFTFPVGIAAICAPAAGKRQKRGMEFTFTISDGRARQQYGFVKQLFLTNDDESTTVVCILGARPLYVWFTWILRLFHARILHDPSRATAMALLNAIRTEGGDGTAEFSVRDALDGPTQAMYFFPLHPPGEFGMRTMEPHVLSNRSFTSKIKSPTVLLVMLSALLHEQKVLLVHDERDVLRGTCHMLVRLLSPFVWKHLLIPVLPTELLHYAQAPIPFLMGMSSAHYKSASLANVVVFNLQDERIELRHLATGFPTLADECHDIPAAANSMVNFAKLCLHAPTTSSSRDPTGTTTAFRQDLQHCFSNTPDAIEACVHAFFYHLFCNDAQYLRCDMLQNQWVVDTELFLRSRKAIDSASQLRFLAAFCTREVAQVYFHDRLARHATNQFYHGPLSVCLRSGDFTYASLRRLLTRRTTYVQEYPSITQTLNGLLNTQDKASLAMKELRPLADATYNMDQCGLMVDMLWERLNNSDFTTLSSALQILIYMALHGCEIAMEYMRFKECQRDHCAHLKSHSARGIVAAASLLLDFMTTPHRWFAMRKTHSQELWLSTVNFQRLEIRPAHIIPSFQALHHAIGGFHEPVHSINLLDLDFDKPHMLSTMLNGVGGFDSDGFPTKLKHDDPFDTHVSFPTHWG
ncbi:Aste57867_21165 [Aphanomyces stellatus]|uniref:Aste57867_21165 protein n=1 Tax=Aphanomyces stellatus TaxID=120398 RepID=A0A485LGX3_9STRA|nr:hypothetical protein As57867_021097 [Aphanomyces stellatus]VFT97839.1 Aste57867_21165 [Aphanomyces stellatus]